MSDLLVLGLEENQEKVEKIVEKLEEARTIASELASTKIYIQDNRKKDLDSYIEELRSDFKKTFHHEPQGYYLVAEGQNGRCQISLPEKRKFF
ncbi:hypothetical protein DN397_22110 [Bacillus sp. AY1-10]|uniref:hypothetical protein n=1 Tax=Bacillus sp. AY1-10 TaxID=2217823 RepID=UPI0011EDD90E|nr:hypothetical protein [Bacillus sp. AY1-10]KAA0748411.1 hypothetical protein DN397_22110 [Bacillus sp. AY1-10]